MAEFVEIRHISTAIICTNKVVYTNVVHFTPLALFSLLKGKIRTFGILGIIVTIGTIGTIEPSVFCTYLNPLLSFRR